MSEESLLFNLIYLIFVILLSLITKILLFKKAGVQGWKAIIPLYGEAVSYKITNMSMLWVLSEVPLMITKIPSLKIPIWLIGLAYFINYGVDVIFSIKLSKAFNRGKAFMILSFFQ